MSQPPGDNSNQSAAQRNYSFIESMNRNRLESDTLNFREVDQRIAAIMHKLAELAPTERNEWTEIHQAKIAALARAVLEGEQGTGFREGGRAKLRALKEQLRMMVIVCRRLKLQYDGEAVMDAIKRVYFSEYGEQILPNFFRAGYSTHEFKVVTGEESSFFSFCCWLGDADS